MVTGEQAIQELFQDAEIKKKVEEVWAKVFHAGNKVLQHAKQYGFLGMEIVPKPNIHEMMVSLQLFSALIDVLITNADSLGIEYDETRLMLNAKEQITRMERVAVALRANNRGDFEAAVKVLETQAPF